MRVELRFDRGIKWEAFDIHHDDKIKLNLEPIYTIVQVKQLIVDITEGIWQPHQVRLRLANSTEELIEYPAHPSSSTYRPKPCRLADYAICDGSVLLADVVLTPEEAIESGVEGYLDTGPYNQQDLPAAPGTDAAAVDPDVRQHPPPPRQAAGPEGDHAGAVRQPGSGRAADPTGPPRVATNTTESPPLTPTHPHAPQPQQQQPPPQPQSEEVKLYSDEELGPAGGGGGGRSISIVDHDDDDDDNEQGHDADGEGGNQEGVAGVQGAEEGTAAGEGRNQGEEAQEDGEDAGGADDDNDDAGTIGDLCDSDWENICSADEERPDGAAASDDGGGDGHGGGGERGGGAAAAASTPGLRRRRHATAHGGDELGQEQRWCLRRQRRLEGPEQLQPVGRKQLQRRRQQHDDDEEEEEPMTDIISGSEEDGEYDGEGEEGEAEEESHEEEEALEDEVLGLRAARQRRRLHEAAEGGGTYRHHGPPRRRRNNRASAAGGGGGAAAAAAAAASPGGYDDAAFGRVESPPVNVPLPGGGRRANQAAEATEAGAAGAGRGGGQTPGGLERRGRGPPAHNPPTAQPQEGAGGGGGAYGGEVRVIAFPPVPGGSYRTWSTREVETLISAMEQHGNSWANIHEATGLRDQRALKDKWRNLKVAARSRFASTRTQGNLPNSLQRRISELAKKY